MDQPHWIVAAVVGALIGIGLRYFLRSVVFVIRSFKKHPLAGRWHEHHWSFINEEERFVTGEWVIKRGYFHRLAVEFTINVGKPLRYKGHLILERGHMIAVLQAVSHDEHLFYRFVSPIPSNENRVGGLWMSYDHDGDICSSAALLSRDELKEEDAQRDIKKLAGVLTGVPILRIR